MFWVSGLNACEMERELQLPEEGLQNMAHTRLASHSQATD